VCVTQHNGEQLQYSISLLGMSPDTHFVIPHTQTHTRTHTGEIVNLTAVFIHASEKKHTSKAVFVCIYVAGHRHLFNSSLPGSIKWHWW